MQINRLLDNCINDDTRDIVTAILNTGMRRREALNLKLQQIRNDFICLDKTKTDEPRRIPINDDLAELFKEIRKRNQLRPKYLFCDSKGGAFK